MYTPGAWQVKSMKTLYMLQIMEILKTGELWCIAYEKTDDVEATHIFPVDLTLDWLEEF